jgi:transcription antitermination factor NusA-like protein
LKNDILCNGCAERVGSEEIKVDEIKMFRRLNELLKDQRNLKDVEIKRAVGNDVLMIITNKDDISKLIGKEGRTVKKLSKELDRPVKIVEQSPDIKDFVKDVFSSVPVIGINVIYKPEGKMYKIRIKDTERTKLPLSSEIFASVSRSLFHIDTDIVFE